MIGHHFFGAATELGNPTGGLGFGHQASFGTTSSRTTRGLFSFSVFGSGGRQGVLVVGSSSSATATGPWKLRSGLGFSESIVEGAPPLGQPKGFFAFHGGTWNLGSLKGTLAFHATQRTQALIAGTVLTGTNI